MTEECWDRGEHAPGPNKEYKRLTDKRREGLCPYNIRINYSTYFGIVAVLMEVRDKVSVLPMDDGADDLPWVLETYPKAVSDERNIESTGYKDQTMCSLHHRKRIVKDIRLDLLIDDEDRLFALSNDNALDSLLAAYATFEAVKGGYEPPDDDEWCPVEGYIHA